MARRRVGGGAVEDLASSLNHPAGVAMDSTHVYWTSYRGGEVARTQK